MIASSLFVFPAQQHELIQVYREAAGQGDLNMNELIPTLTRGQPSLKVTFLVQEGWPHKRDLLQSSPRAIHTDTNSQ